MSRTAVSWWKWSRPVLILVMVAALFGLAIVGVWATVGEVNIDSPTQASPVYVQPGGTIQVQYDAAGDEVVTVKFYVGGMLAHSEMRTLPVTDRTVSFAEPGVLEGKYDLKVEVEGSTTQSDQESEAVWIDGTPPSDIEITAPAGCSASVDSIAGTASDALSGVQTVYVKIKDTTDNLWWNGSAWVGTDPGWLTASGTDTWSYSAAGLSFADGKSYQVWAKAEDKALNESDGTDSVSFTIDASAPEANITNPPSGWVRSLPSISGTASDSGCGGLSQVLVQVYNITGNRYWNGSAWVSTESWNLATETESWSYDLPTFTAGRQYRISVKAVDSVNNWSSLAQATFWFDDVEPSVSITAPEGATYYNASTIPAAFAGTASDAHSGLNKVELTLQRSSDSKYWDGEDWVDTETLLPADGTDEWSYDDLPMWNDGETYVLSAKATDNAGNDPWTSVTFHYDVSAPSVTIDDIADVVGCGFATISGTASDTFSGVDKVLVSLDGGTTWSEAEYDPDTGAWTLDVSEVEFNDHAAYTVQAKAVDVAGNESDAVEDSFTFDACPVVAITSPTSGSNIPASGTIEGTADDGLGAVVAVYVQIDDGGWVLATDTSAGGTWATWEYNYSDLGDGPHTIQAKAVDDFGQESLSDPIYVSVGANTAIQVNVNAVDNYTQPTGFSGTASVGDPLSISHVEITIEGPSGFWNGMGWQEDEYWLSAVGTTAWSYDATLVPFLGGETYIVTARAWDTAGGFNVSGSVTFTYGSSWDITLNAGWNLISLPLIPNDEDIADVLAGLPVVRVSRWTPGVGEERWEPSPSPIQQFSTMTTGRGYWVRMSSAATLVNAGLFQPKPPAAPKSYALSAGWNLIGYHVTAQEYFDDPKTVSQYLGALLGSVRAMYYFEGGVYKIPASGDDMKVGFGYWVALDAPGILYP